MVVFIDGILIYSKNKEEHLSHLRIMLQTLREHQLYAKLKKCEFWFTEVTYLGHVASKEVIKFYAQKIKMVTEWSTNMTEVRSFLGLAGYYSSCE